MADFETPSMRRSFLPRRVRDLSRQIVLKSYILGLGVSIILGGGYFLFGGGTGQTQGTQTLASVERRTIVSSVKSTGKVTFASEQTLKFNQKGTVAKVNVKEGDRVKQGQLIAQLDASTVSADIRQAQLSLNASALQLQQIQSDKEKTLLDAQNTLTVAQEKLPTDLASAERDAEEKKASLEQAKAALEQAKITTLQDLGSTAQSILRESEDLIDTLHGVLVNDASARRSSGSKDIDVYYRLYNDPAKKDLSENNYYTAVDAADAMRSTYGNSLPTLHDIDALSSAIQAAQTTAIATHALADSVYRMLQGATDDPNDLTVSDINALKQAAGSARNSAASLVTDAETAQASLTGNKRNLTSIAIQQKEDALSSAENALLAAKENLRVLQTEVPGNLESEQLTFASTTKTIDINYKLKQNDVAQKATSLQKTQKTLRDYQLTAPFDGVITHNDYKVGDNLQDTGEDKYAVIQNPDFIVVTIPLDQVDVVRVRKDMTAHITFDAVPGQDFQGAIDAIDPTPIEQSGVVSYNVEIKLPTPKDLTVLSGMTATVTIETSKKENALTVPNLALSTQGTAIMVQTAAGRTVPVTTGATDGRYTEILTGVQEGDSIISVNVSAAATTNGTNANATQQLFRLGGGAGGFGAGGGGGGRAGGGTRAP